MGSVQSPAAPLIGMGGFGCASGDAQPQTLVFLYLAAMGNQNFVKHLGH